MRSLLLLSAFAATNIYAQSSIASSEGSSSTPTVRTITVGKGGNVFVPTSIQANVGDIVSFQFYPANHSVVKSQYGYPCIPYEDLGPDRTGWFSGFFPLAAITDNLPTYNITINDTQPLFYYCTAPGSCIDYGMVGAINPNESTPVSAQVTLAKEASYMLQPGEAFPAEASASAASLASTALATVTATATTTASPSATSSSTATSHRSLSNGAIAGIAIAGAALLALAGALFYFIGRSRSLKQSLTNKHGSPTSSTPSTAKYPESGFIAQDPSSHHNSTALPHYAFYHEQKQPNSIGLGITDDLDSVRSASPPNNMTSQGTPFMHFPQPIASPPLHTWTMEQQRQQQQQQQQQGQSTDARYVRSSVTPSELAGQEVGYYGSMPAVHELDAAKSPLLEGNERADAGDGDAGEGMGRGRSFGRGQE